MTLWLWCAVGAAGGCGAVARFVLDAGVGDRFGRGFPLGTFAVNLTGAFLLGVLSGARLAPEALLVAGTATVGSYTTFSTWMLESQRLAEDGGARALAANLIVSLAGGVLAAALGRAIGGQL